MEVLNHGEYIGRSVSMNEGDGFIKVLDIHSQSGYSFFEQQPKAMSRNSKSPNTISPVFAVDHTNQRILVTFEYPGNPVEFFVFSIKGKLLRTFELPLDPGFLFPSFSQTYPIKYPPKSHTAIVDSIHFHKGLYWVFIVKLHRKRKDVVKSEITCIILDEKGKRKKEFEVEKGTKVFSISPDGFLLAKNFYSETESLLIYRLK